MLGGRFATDMSISGCRHVLDMSLSAILQLVYSLSVCLEFGHKYTRILCLTISLEQCSNYRGDGGISPALQGVVLGISYGHLIPARDGVIPGTNAELIMIITWLVE